MERCAASSSGAFASRGASEVGALLAGVATRLVPDESGPGVALVAVGPWGATIVTRGAASIEHRTVLTAGTPMYAASLSKLVTAVAVHRCVAAGLLRLDDSLARWFPDLAGAERLTIAHLVEHRSGLPEYHALRLLAGHHVEDVLTSDDVIGLVDGMSLWFEPGTQVAYNNTNYAVLAHVVAAVCDTTWPVAARRWVLDPVGASDGDVRPSPTAWLTGMASCYVAGPDGSWSRATLGCASIGDGGWWASPSDLAALAVGLLDGYIGDDDVARPLRRAEPLPPGVSSGLRSGCVEVGEGSHAWFGGRAEFVGARAELRVYPGVGGSLIAIANSQHLALGAALDELAVELIGEPLQESPPMPFVHGPQPDGWFLAAGGAGVWEVRVDEDGSGRAAIGALAFDLASDGACWAVPSRPAVRLGWIGDELVVRDGDAEIVRLRPVDVRAASADEIAAAAGVFDCPSARTVLRVAVTAPPEGPVVTVARGDAPPEPASVVGLISGSFGGAAVLVSTPWGAIEVPVGSSSSGRAILGRAETVPVERLV